MRDVRRHRSLFLYHGIAWAAPAWHPHADVYRRGPEWLVKLELAGVDPDDITLALDGTTLVVRGTRRDRALEHGWRCQGMEIAYSRFERRIPLPADIVGAHLRSEYRDGMLLLHIAPPEAGR